MIRGGLRTRLVVDSARLTIIAGLTDLGWFDGTIHDNPPGPRHHQPVQYVPRPKQWDDTVTANSVAISTEDVYDDPLGLGGEVEDTVEVYVDVFAESDPLGWQIAMDVRDVALGKLPEQGRVGPVIDVYDLRQATPVPFTQVEVTDVQVDRADGDARTWRAHWFMVRLRLVDDYADEGDANLPTTSWAPTFAPAWAQIQAITL